MSFSRTARRSCAGSDSAMTATPTEAFNARELAPGVESSLKIADRVYGRHSCVAYQVCKERENNGFSRFRFPIFMRVREASGVTGPRRRSKMISAASASDSIARGPEPARNAAALERQVRASGSSRHRE